MSHLQLAAALMVKNEERRIEATLKSVKNVVDGIVVFDTGSVDKTIDIIKKFVKKENLHFHLLQGHFEDFATSRNMLLDFTEQHLYDYVLLLDSNDEFKSSMNLKEILHARPEQGFMLHHQLYIGPEETLDYYNIKLIKPGTGFRYKGVAHEYIEGPPGATIGKLNEDVVLYQDRAIDNDGETHARWKKDLVLLRKDIARNPTNGRTQFYLAQTYDCLNMKKDAIFFYKQRSNNEGGFFEERFNSMMKCGDLEHDDDERVKWYLKAYQIIERAEPLVKIAKLFRKKDTIGLAFVFAKLACELQYPLNCVLWVDKKCYNHDRWQELGIVAYYMKEYKLGKEACEKAIESGYDGDLNMKNLLFYEKNGDQEN